MVLYHIKRLRQFSKFEAHNETQGGFRETDMHDRSGKLKHWGIFTYEDMVQGRMFFFEIPETPGNTRKIKIRQFRDFLLMNRLSFYRLLLIKWLKYSLCIALRRLPDEKQLSVKFSW